ncbi:MAG TPA: dicarboxylate/amino acid:cation symporter, partial [Petrimonas sp.]|uniref:dicarboxylate/amino acid:cation symporter n=1 Tax=Petrimonas sp. TaxID=2023866 RepID=UPI001757B81C|nr:dicarboxylate/amino acid:cation symporter [Petrimonas sp.]
MSYYKIGFGLRVFTAMLLGIAAGAVLKETVTSLVTLGSIYVSLIKMVVMPLVASAIISSITAISDPKQLKTIGLKAISLFLITTALATIIGIGVGVVIDPGAGIQLPSDQSFKAREIPSFTKVILDLVPSNPVGEMAGGKIIPVIVFSIFIALAIVIESGKKPEAVKPVKDFITAFANIMFRVTKLVIGFTPYGVLGLMAGMSAKYGITTLLPLGKIIVSVYAASLLHMVLVYSSLVSFAAKLNPILFFRNIYPVMAVAFTTRSSYATLPVNMEVITKQLKVSEKIASFVAPLGATINMNGCGGLWPAIVAIFVARIYNIELSLGDYFLLVGSATVASIGTAGVPGPASISTTVVLTSLGLPLEGMALVLGIDPIVDMARTAVNATGTTVASLVIANSE